jgi:hypothetical protein
VILQTQSAPGLRDFVPLSRPENILVPQHFEEGRSGNAVSGLRGPWGTRRFDMPRLGAIPISSHLSIMTVTSAVPTVSTRFRSLIEFCIKPGVIACIWSVYAD